MMKVVSPLMLMLSLYTGRVRFPCTTQCPAALVSQTLRTVFYTLFPSMRARVDAVCEYRD